MSCFCTWSWLLTALSLCWWLRSIWLRTFSCGCSVFDLQALILNRFFSVVLQTEQKENQRSLRPLDVTVNPKITSQLGVSPYNGTAQWLALHNNVYPFSQAVAHTALKVVQSYFWGFLSFLHDVWARKPQGAWIKQLYPYYDWRNYCT